MYSTQKVNKRLGILFCIFSVVFLLSACKKAEPEKENVIEGENQDVVELSEQTKNEDSFAEGVEITSDDDSSFTFESEDGSTSISKEIPEGYPSELPRFEDGELLSASEVGGAEGDMITLFWNHERSFSSLESVVSDIEVLGYVIESREDFDDSMYVQFMRGNERVIFSVSETENGTREVMMTYQK